MVILGVAFLAPVRGLCIRGRDRRRAAALLGAAAVVAVLLLSVGPFPTAFPVGSAPGSSSLPSSSGGLVVAPAYVPGPGVSRLGAMPSTTSVSVEVGLAPSDPAGMQAALDLASTPGTPQYHQYLSPAEIAARFAPTPSSYERAAGYFQGFGLTVTTSPDRWNLLVSGPSMAVGAAFSTRFSEYRVGAHEFYSHESAATLPTGYGWSSALGLGNASSPRPSVTGPFPLPATSAAPSPQACSTSAPYEPCAIDSAYNVSGLLGTGKNGTGYRLAVVDVYDAAETQTQLASDLSSFTTAFSLPSGNVRYLYPVPTSRNLNATYTGWGFEEALDFEWARASAPGATVEMTFAPDPTTGLYATVDWLVAHQAADVISLSWGEPDVGIFNSYAGPCPGGCNASSDGSYTIFHPVMVAAALEGITVLAASGDCGAAMGTNGVATSYPASDPAVTGVGATDLTLTSGGAYSSESGWSGNASGATYPGCANQGGSGGGWSPFPRPAWQNETGFKAVDTHRGVPDVSINGGTSVLVYVGGSAAGVGGTSVSCPIWAGLVTIGDQVAGLRLGLLNPSLYELARSSLASKVFHDVTSGRNNYPAGKGWDAVTGIGSPNAGALLPHLAAGSVVPSTVGINLTVTPRSGAAPLKVVFHAFALGATAPVYAYDVDFGDYNATWTTSGWANWTYKHTGVFLARATVFLADGNSTVSLPTAIQVGGTGSLNVSLAASTTAPSAGAPVTFNATAVGGTPAYRYTFSYGDGTYTPNTTLASVVHDYPVAGSYCANVVAWDSASPAASGASLRLGLGVGGASVPTCGNPTPLHASFSLPTTVAIPGDLGLNFTAAGGTPPYSVHYVSDDAYVTACQCGIFRSVGHHTVWAFVNDSLLGSVEVNASLTVTPALQGWFNASALVGVAPFSVTFTGHAVGGVNGSIATVNWDFGDGATGGGPSVAHTFATSGVYVVHASVVDAAGWEVSRIFVVDALATSAPGALAVGVAVTPGSGGMFGALSRLNATASGGTPGYTYYWNLGDGGSAYGPNAAETYGPPRCGTLSCPTSVALNVSDASGARLSVTIPFAQPTTAARTWAELRLNETVGPRAGSTPLTVTGTAAATAMPGAQVLWSYAPGASNTGGVGYYTYLAPGNFTLNVSATDAFGDVVVHDHAITVDGLVRIAPTVSGGPSTTEGIAPLDVGFGAAASGGAGGPYAFSWQFGDGATSAVAVTNHTYASAGAFAANLTVTDAIGTPTRLNWTVRVYAVATVTFQLNATPSSVGPFGAYTVNISAAPACRAGTVPTCAAGNVSATLYVRNWSANQSAAPGWALPLASNGAGVWKLVLRAPDSATGVGAVNAIALTVTAGGPNYTGSLDANVTIVPSTAGGGAGPYSGYLLPLGLGIAVVAAVAIAVGYVVLRKRRKGPASPSRPPSGPAAPPGA